MDVLVGVMSGGKAAALRLAGTASGSILDREDEDEVTSVLSERLAATA